MSHRRSQRAPYSVLSIAVLATSVLGCAPEFDPASELNGLRVLAVQKDKPYAAPGDVVNLQMLWHDADPPAPRQIQIAWLAACYNPPSDLFSLCFADNSWSGAFPSLGGVQPSTSVAAQVLLDAGAGDAGAGDSDAAGPLLEDASGTGGAGGGGGATIEGAPGLSVPVENLVLEGDPFPATVGYGESFSFQMPEQIVSSRPPPQGSNQHYGVAYVFFALCAGEVRFEPSENFPLVCYDGSSRLSSEDFVAGYSAVYAYEDQAIKNLNPQITGLLVNGVATEEFCIGAECSGLIAPSSSEPGQCSAANRLPLCENTESCENVKIKPIIDQSQPAESDTALTDGESQDLTEQMWVNYYIDRGEFSSDLRLLNDAVKGWNPDYEAEYLPTASGTAYVWAVAHDNRGGTQWVRTQLCIE